MNEKILMVEDDFALAMGTEYSLTSEGYQVVTAGTVKEAEERFDDTFSLVLLDMLLPDGNGIEFCSNLRRKGSNVPVIFLTAISDEINIVQGLENGADDYITKPYRVRELLARIRVNIKRYKIEENKEERVYCFGNSCFYPEKFILLQNGEKLECTTSELKLLGKLLRNKGNVITRSQIMEELYDTGGDFFEDNTLSVYVKRLRDKLGTDGDYIETVRGVGYRFKKHEG